MYQLKDRWTTRDGSWDADGRPYAISKEMEEKYGSEIIDGKGCATCIFTKLEGGPAQEVLFETNGGYEETHGVNERRWTHATMYNPGSGYDPKVVPGPWSVSAVAAPSAIVDNIGLPGGEHVSHFVVLEWNESDAQPEIPGEEDGPTPADPPTSEDKAWVEVTIGDKTYVGYVNRAGE